LESPDTGEAPRQVGQVDDRLMGQLADPDRDQGEKHVHQLTDRNRDQRRKMVASTPPASMPSQTLTPSLVVKMGGSICANRIERCLPDRNLAGISKQKV